MVSYFTVKQTVSIQNIARLVSVTVGVSGCCEIWVSGEVCGGAARCCGVAKIIIIVKTRTWGKRRRKQEKKKRTVSTSTCSLYGVLVCVRVLT